MKPNDTVAHHKVDFFFFDAKTDQIDDVNGFNIQCSIDLFGFAGSSVQLIDTAADLFDRILRILIFSCRLPTTQST